MTEQSIPARPGDPPSTESGPPVEDDTKIEVNVDPNKPLPD